MHFLDWIILSVPLIALIAIGLYTHHYMKSVAQFMSGGRLAGRYLLAVAKGEMGAGAVVFVWAFEMISQSGFVLTWWQKIAIPVGLIISTFGFVMYRYRETRAMTLAQFFEIRYNKSFRVFTGALGFTAGILNFGIIPAVGSRFLVYFLGLPANVTIFSYTFPTFYLLMAALLTFTVILTLSGGLITLMITDCLEGIMSQVFYIIIIAALLYMFNWSEISRVLLDRAPGHSLLDPFDAGKVSDFNLSYVLMTICTGIYATMAWQNASAYNSAALTAHESRMGRLLGNWREMGKGAVVTLLAIGAMTFLAHPDFASQSEHARNLISQISEPQIQKQMRIPIAVSEMLPVGVKGLLAAVLIMGVFGGDSTHLHSWGGILVQDVLMPLRKKPFTPKQHIRALRLSIMGVAIFAYLFGCLFKQTEYVSMWFQITTGIFVGGAGAAIIGGLYWKKGTAEGAWAAVITGSLLSFAGIVVRQVYGNSFPLNGTQIYFFTSLSAVLVYVITSLLTCKEDFNMERMLHRGKYSIASEAAAPVKHKFSWAKLVGIDENFTKGDKWLAGGLLGWGLFGFTLFVTVTLWNLFVARWPISWWSTYWHIFSVVIPVGFTITIGIWFTWGGLHDMKKLFVNLKQAKVNDLDDGSVQNHQNLDELEPETASESKAKVSA